ncbi:hypothetical protein ACPEIF_14610 [Streptomyces sp. NPDC012600]|uniref:hypothetical protein n=1 Tax=Streptomyces sp. NPDC012600 TaxID=3415005 RepID=UPI003C30D853
MTGAVWSPVVLGRLLRVDEWWREVPEGATGDGWLVDVVIAAVMNGRGLSKGPRMLLARPPVPDGEAAPVLVGVACDAELISTKYHTDSGGRPLYCFVGWLSAPGAGDVPSLGALTEGFPSWARETYERAVGPDWEAVTAPGRRDPRVPGDAPWGPAGAAGSGGGPAGLRTGLPTEPPARLPGAEGPGTWLLPEARAGEYWEGARMSDEPCVLVTGWRESYAPARSVLTHLCGAGVTNPVFDGEPVASGTYNSSKTYGSSGTYASSGTYVTSEKRAASKGTAVPDEGGASGEHAAPETSGGSRVKGLWQAVTGVPKAVSGVVRKVGELPGHLSGRKRPGGKPAGEPSSVPDVSVPGAFTPGVFAVRPPGSPAHDLLLESGWAEEPRGGAGADARSAWPDKPSRAADQPSRRPDSRRPGTEEDEA